MSASKTRVTVGATARLHLADVGEGPRAALRRLLRLANPDWSQGSRPPPWGPPQWLPLCRLDGDELAVPRAMLPGVAEILGGVDVVDETSQGQHLRVNLRTAMRGYQAAAVDEMAGHSDGVLVAPTGSGKTAMGCALISRHGRDALIIAPTRDLVAQWREAVREHLGIDAGALTDGAAVARGVVLATPQGAMARCPDLIERFGVLVVDECHRAASPTYENLLYRLDARYRYGLTATPTRPDELEPIVFAHLGPVRHTVERDDLEAAGHLLRPLVCRVETDFRFPYAGPADWHALLTALYTDDERNSKIVDVIVSECGEATVGLVLTPRIDHATHLAKMVRDRGLRAGAVTGDLSLKIRAQRIAAARHGELDVLVATTLADEGLDIPRLSRLFLAGAQKAEARLVQRVGRVIRPHHEKGAPVIFDFADSQCGVLANQARKRAAVFAAHWGERGAV